MSLTWNNWHSHSYVSYGDPVQKSSLQKRELYCNCLDMLYVWTPSSEWENLIERLKKFIYWECQVEVNTSILYRVAIKELYCSGCLNMSVQEYCGAHWGPLFIALFMIQWVITMTWGQYSLSCYFEFQFITWWQNTIAAQEGVFLTC